MEIGVVDLLAKMDYYNIRSATEIANMFKKFEEFEDPFDAIVFISDIREKLLSLQQSGIVEFIWKEGKRGWRRL